jgi:hypothetical protein
MRARSHPVFAALGLAAALGGCNSTGYSACYQVECPYPSAHEDSSAGYVLAHPPHHPAFGELPFDDPSYDYTHRSLTISPGAGNAQAANMALQTTTPWPRYSRDTNIPGNGAQMTKAIHEFESGQRPPLQSTGGGGPAIEINNNSVGSVPPVQ